MPYLKQLDKNQGILLICLENMDALLCIQIQYLQLEKNHSLLQLLLILVENVDMQDTQMQLKKDDDLLLNFVENTDMLALLKKDDDLLLIFVENMDMLALHNIQTHCLMQLEK